MCHQKETRSILLNGPTNLTLKSASNVGMLSCLVLSLMYKPSPLVIILCNHKKNSRRPDVPTLAESFSKAIKLFWAFILVGIKQFTTAHSINSRFSSSIDKHEMLQGGDLWACVAGPHRGHY